METIFPSDPLKKSQVGAMTPIPRAEAVSSSSRSLSER